MFTDSEFVAARMPASTNKMFGVRWWLLLFVVGVTVTRTVAGGEARVVCYYTNWSVYRPGTARFNPQNINPYLCTHLIYAFGGFTKDNTLKPFDKYQDIEKGGYAKFTGLKTYNKELKTLLAIGGWNEGSTRFSPMVSARDRRKEFVRNAIKFLRQNRFDGLDLDWEYPAFRDGGKPKDRENYAKLVKELREEFEKEAEKTGRPRLLLTMAVPAGIEYIQKGFDVKTLNQYLDWLNLLTYDYHSAFEPTVNHHAPLYPLEEPNEYSVDGELNIDYTIQYYLDNGADREKLVLGIPTYGRSYTLFNAQATDIGSPADGPGEQGDATREKGYLAYYEICEAIKGKPKTEKPKVDDEDSDEDEEEAEEDEPWTVVQPNPDAMGPYAYRGNQWVGYDDVDIAKKKAEYVAEKGLGGIMFWSIDNDDFRGNCHGKPYPLIEAAKEALITKLGSRDNVVATERAVASATSSRRKSRPRLSSTPAAPSSTRSPKPSKKQQVALSSTPAWAIDTPEPPTTPDPGSDFKCTDEGFFPHPRDCKKYFWCLDSGPSNLGIVAHQFTCPSGLFFNKAADSCDFARNVLCKKPAATTSAPTTARTTTTTSAARTTTTTTTTRRPVKLSTKSSALFRTTSTTTSAPEEEDELIGAEIEEDTDSVDSEDPRVIKELIDLIRKVGGVEQLERHLKLAEGSNSASADGTTTGSPISKKLYQKVLESRQNTKNLFQKYNSISKDARSGQNSRTGPQNAGLDAGAAPDTTSSRREKPQYTTINRARPSTPAKEEEVAESREKADSLEEENRDSLRNTDVSVKPLPQYVNIRRPRPQQTNDVPDDTASRNALFERNEAPIVPHAETEAPVDFSSARRENIPEYVTIRRQRPTTTTTEEPTTSAKYQVLERETISSSVVEESITPSVAKNQYSTLQRVRSSTTEASLTSPEPTTVLSVQISSLLNIPSDVPESSSIEGELVTDGSSTTTTTASTSAPSSTTTLSNASPVTSTRRPGLRRRGTTTPQPITSTTGQNPPNDRRKNFIRRTTKAPGTPTSTLADEAPVTQSTTPRALTTPRRFRTRGTSKFKSRKPEVNRIPAGKDEDSREGDAVNEDLADKPSLGSVRDTENSGAEAKRPTRTYVRRKYGGGTGTAIPKSTRATTTSTAAPETTPAPAPIGAKSTRRPFRVASRRRPATLSTSSAAPETQNDQPEEIVPVTEEQQPIEEKKSPIKKTVKIQRRPLTSKKEKIEPPKEDQNAASSLEAKRESKKYSASIKQNQLDELIKKASAEIAKESIDEDISSETAIAIATHQLLSAPLPVTPVYKDYDDDKPKTKKAARKQQSTAKPPTTRLQQVTTTRKPVKYDKDYIDQSSEDYTSPVYSNIGTLTQGVTTGYSSTPAYSSVRTSNIIDPYSSQTIFGPATAEYFNINTNKYISIPIDEFGYSTDSYTGGLGHEPVYFTRDYLMESPVTGTYDANYYHYTTTASPPPVARSTKRPLKKISTTLAPSTLPYLEQSVQPRKAPEKGIDFQQTTELNAGSPKYFKKDRLGIAFNAKPDDVRPSNGRTRSRDDKNGRAIYDKAPKPVYDKVATPQKSNKPTGNFYYKENNNANVFDEYNEGSQVIVKENGNIQCLDQGNFPHPTSCKKFISCAKMETGGLIGWEYVCPKGLSYDPIGGMCNWSVGLGCNE